MSTLARHSCSATKKVTALLMIFLTNLGADYFYGYVNNVRIYVFTWTPISQILDSCLLTFLCPKFRIGLI